MCDVNVTCLLYNVRYFIIKGIILGTCKGCNEVKASVFMVDGYCRDCDDKNPTFIKQNEEEKRLIKEGRFD